MDNELSENQISKKAHCSRHKVRAIINAFAFRVCRIQKEFEAGQQEIADAIVEIIRENQQKRLEFIKQEIIKEEIVLKNRQNPDSCGSVESEK